MTLNGCVMACGAFHNIVTFLLYEASVWLILSSYIWHFSVLDLPKGIHDPWGNGINLLKKLLSSNTCIKYPLKKSYFPFDVKTTEKKLKMINLLDQYIVLISNKKLNREVIWPVLFNNKTLLFTQITRVNGLQSYPEVLKETTHLCN